LVVKKSNEIDKDNGNKRNRLTNLFTPKKGHDKTLKRSMSGFETETFILNNEGKIDNSDLLLNKAKKAALDVKEECAKGMIEVICLPSKKLSSTTFDLLNNVTKLSEIAEDNDQYLYPFACYPGVNKPVFRSEPWYTIKQNILGKRFVNAGLCCGYHQHYALPWGMFDEKTKSLNYKLNSKVKRTLLDSYNMLNAIDPIITLFLQSSPFVNGKFVGKDSRLIVYRGGKKLDNMDGLYANHQFFGGLSPYKQTLMDLMSTIRRKHSKWNKLMRENGYKKKEDTSILQFAWNPVKVNNKGTLEYRGGDMNYMTNILAASTTIKFLLRKIQQDFTLVIPMDIELKESFTVENNMLFIPPHTMVRNDLQKHSAYDGLDNKDVRIYTERFFKFIKSITYKSYKPLLKPFQTMIEEKQTMSDTILKQVKKDGYDKEIPDEYARELAINYSNKFRKDLKLSRELLEKIGSEVLLKNDCE